MTEREVMADLVRFVGVLTYGKERWFKQNGCWYDRMFGDCIQNEVFLERITEAINDEIADRPTWECKDCTYWDKLDYDAPRHGWCNQFEEWTDADEFCSRCAKMKGGEEE